MSGGSFDYAYGPVDGFADELEARLDIDPDFPSDAVRPRLRRLVDETRKVAALMKEAEWLYSGDHSEETFMKLVAQIDAESGA